MDTSFSECFFIICSQNAYLTMARTFNRGKNAVKQNKTVEHLKKMFFTSLFRRCPSSSTLYTQHSSGKIMQGGKKTQTSKHRLISFSFLVFVSWRLKCAQLLNLCPLVADAPGDLFSEHEEWGAGGGPAGVEQRPPRRAAPDPDGDVPRRGGVSPEDTPPGAAGISGWAASSRGPGVCMCESLFMGLGVGVLVVSL